MSKEGENENDIESTEQFITAFQSHFALYRRISPLYVQELRLLEVDLPTLAAFTQIFPNLKILKILNANLCIEDEEGEGEDKVHRAFPLHALPRLESLSLSDCKLSVSSFPLCNYSNITKIEFDFDISDPEVEKVIFSALMEMKSLAEFKSFFYVPTKVLHELKALKNLSFLIFEDAVSDFEQYSSDSLESLTLYGDGQFLPTSVLRLKNLKHLKLGNFEQLYEPKEGDGETPKQSPIYFENQNLISLHLDGVSEFILPIIKNLNADSLRSFSIRFVTFEMLSAVLKLLNRFTYLESLALQFQNSEEELVEVLAESFDSLKNIKELSIEREEPDSKADRTLLRAVGKLPGLTMFDSSFPFPKSQTLLNDLLVNFAKANCLSALKLTGLKFLNAEVLFDKLKSLKDLQILHLSFDGGLNTDGDLFGGLFGANGEQEEEDDEEEEEGDDVEEESGEEEDEAEEKEVSGSAKHMKYDALVALLEALPNLRSTSFVLENGAIAADFDGKSKEVSRALRMKFIYLEEVRVTFLGRFAHFAM